MDETKTGTGEEGDCDSKQEDSEKEIEEEVEEDVEAEGDESEDEADEEAQEAEDYDDAAAKKVECVALEEKIETINCEEKLKSNLLERYKYIYKFVAMDCVYFMNIILLFLGNKWTWNVLTMVGKLLVAVFVYLVLATSTLIITIMINTHDTFYTHGSAPEKMDIVQRNYENEVPA